MGAVWWLALKPIVTDVGQLMVGGHSRKQKGSKTRVTGAVILIMLLLLSKGVEKEFGDHYDSLVDFCGAPPTLRGWVGGEEKI